MRRVLNRGEAVNALELAIYKGRISPPQAKHADEMQAVADGLSLLANIVTAWKTMQMQGVVNRWANRHYVFTFHHLPFKMCIVSSKVRIQSSAPLGLNSAE